MGSWNVCVRHDIHLLDDVRDWSPDKWGWLALFTRFSLNLDFRPLSRELWRRAELKTGRCYFDIHNPHREMTSSNNTWLIMTKNSIFVLLKPFWTFHLFLEIILILSFFSDKRPEQSIAAARASVMVYDDLNKKWVPAGSSHGLSKVIIFILDQPHHHHQYCVAGPHLPPLHQQHIQSGWTQTSRPRGEEIIVIW